MARPAPTIWDPAPAAGWMPRADLPNYRPEASFVVSGGIRELASPLPIGRPVAGLDGIYLAIPLATLRLDAITHFDLYLRVPRSRKFMHYRAGQLEFKEPHRQTLLESRVNEVFIRESAREAYVGYLEENLEALIGDADLPASEKCAILYECAVQQAHTALRQPHLGEKIGEARRTIRTTTRFILEQPENMTNLLSMLATDYRLYTHAVNTCVLGLSLGLRIGLAMDELEELGTGLMLHDIGKTRLDPAILRKATPLSQVEWRAYRSHPELGLDALGSDHPIGNRARAVIAEHHERCDGRGFPNRSQATGIHFFAKIAGLVNTFDGLTTGKHQRPPLSSYNALHLMQTEMRTHFNSQLLQELVLMMGAATARRRAPRAGTFARSA